jgi:hypothetical protein
LRVGFLEAGRRGNRCIPPRSRRRRAPRFPCADRNFVKGRALGLSDSEDFAGAAPLFPITFSRQQPSRDHLGGRVEVMVMLLAEVRDRREALRRGWRAFGWLLALVALGFLAYDITEWQQHGGAFKTTAAGWPWLLFQGSAPAPLQGLEHYIWPPLAHFLAGSARNILDWPAFLVFGLPGLAILYTGYGRRARRRPWR